jgi:hypothetical protein
METKGPLAEKDAFDRFRSSGDSSEQRAAFSAATIDVKAEWTKSVAKAATAATRNLKTRS